MRKTLTLFISFILIGMAACSPATSPEATVTLPAPKISMGTMVAPSPEATSVPTLDPTQSIFEQRRADPLLIYVSKSHPLLQQPEVNLVGLEADKKVDQRMFKDLQRFLDDARRAGFDPVINSAFRSIDEQKALIFNTIEYYIQQGDPSALAREKTSQLIAEPGTSEHHLGLAVDISGLDNQYLDEHIADTPLNQWLVAHCAEYGFILRYPKEGVERTGFTYEPWHFRYVGNPAATEIMQGHMLLEDYLGITD